MISSKYLYHFTPEFKYLESILKNKKLRVSYCLEEYDWMNDFGIPFNTIWGNTKEKKSKSIAIPMTCFSDIPAKLMINHIKVYGNYGIGFNEKFKTKYALNPLFYVTKKSSVTTLLQTINILTNRISTELPEYAIKNQIDKLLSYCKPYIGFFQKQNYKDDNHKFYDEREWRYVIPDTLYPPISEEDFNNREDKCVTHLDFDLTDLKIIIVENKFEKDKLRIIAEGIEVRTIEEFINMSK